MNNDSMKEYAEVLTGIYYSSRSNKETILNSVMYHVKNSKGLQKGDHERIIKFAEDFYDELKMDSVLK